MRTFVPVGLLVVSLSAVSGATESWFQVGDDIDGEAAFDESGVAVALSSDGAPVAIGAPFNDGNGDRAGHVRVFSNVGGVIIGYHVLDITIHHVIENIYMDGELQSEIIATNVYRKSHNSWYMVLHHASPELRPAFSQIESEEELVEEDTKTFH